MDASKFSRRILAFTTASALAGAFAIAGSGRADDGTDVASADAAVARAEYNVAETASDTAK